MAEKKGFTVKKTIWITAAALALVLAAAAVLLYLRPDLRYAVKSAAAELFRPRPVLTEVRPAVRETSLEEMTAREDCAADQSLLLVNAAHRLPDGFEPELTEYRDTGVLMNRCVTEAYAALSAAVAERYGEKLYIRSSFRDREEQAQVSAASDGETAAEPGASEHETGLALDVYVAYYAGDGFLKSEAGQFVNSYCQDYGFVIRYPRGREQVTGIRFEPWHIRYVGAPHAAFMAEYGLTLEEYIELLKPGRFYEIGGMLVSRQSGDTLFVPERWTALTVSPDNTGCQILTIRP